MFRTCIDALNASEKKSITFKDDSKTYLILKALHQEAHPTYYAVDTASPLGSGTFGTVFKAYALTEDGHARLEKPLALKVIHDKSDFDEKEIKALTQHFHVEHVFYNRKEVWILQEYVPGLDLLEALQTHRFNFSQIVEIMWKLSLSLSNIHHHSYATGPALIHADIQPGNIKIDYDPVTQIINVYIIDFGLCEKASRDPEDLISTKTGKGSIYYLSSEAFGGRYNVKSDIYALTPIFLYLLSARDPLALKKAQNHPFANLAFINMKIVAAKFCFDQLFSNIILSAELACVKPFMIALLKRMQSSDHQSRPDSSEIVRFMTSLSLLCKLDSLHETDSNEWHEHLARLIVIAYGHWKQPIDFEYQPHPFKKYILSAIAILQKRNCLDANMVNKLIAVPECAYAIHAAHEQKLIDDDLITHIIAHGKNLSMTITQVNDMLTAYEQHKHPSPAPQPHEPTPHPAYGISSNLFSTKEDADQSSLTIRPSTQLSIMDKQL